MAIEPTEAEVDQAAHAIWNSNLLQPARGPWPEKQTVTSAFCIQAARAALTAAAQVRAQPAPRNSAEWFAAVEAILPAGYTITKCAVDIDVDAATFGIRKGE